MKQLLFILFFISSSTFAQCDTTNVIEYPHLEAEYPGGIVALKKFLIENMEYTEDINPIDVSGVYMDFNICQDGNLYNIRCLRTENEKLKNACIELFSKMPKWKPAESFGKPVTSRHRMPVRICFY